MECKENIIGSASLAGGLGYCLSRTPATAEKLVFLFVLVISFHSGYGQILNAPYSLNDSIHLDTLRNFPSKDVSTIDVYSHGKQIIILTYNAKFNKLRNASFIKNGNQYRDLIFHNNGKLWLSISFDNNQYNGLTEIYSNKGKLNAIYEYNNNKISKVIYGRNSKYYLVKNDYRPYIIIFDNNRKGGEGGSQW